MIDVYLFPYASGNTASGFFSLLKFSHLLSPSQLFPIVKKKSNLTFALL